MSTVFSYIALNGEINRYPWNSINRNYIFFRSFNLGNFGDTVIKEIVSTRGGIFMDNKWCIKNMILLHANDASNRILMATFDVSNTFYSIEISFYGNKWCVEQDFMSTTEAWNRLIRQQMMHQNRILWQQMMHQASFYSIKQAFMKNKDSARTGQHTMHQTTFYDETTDDEAIHRAHGKLTCVYVNRWWNKEAFMANQHASIIINDASRKLSWQIHMILWQRRMSWTMSHDK